MNGSDLLRGRGTREGCSFTLQGQEKLPKISLQMDLKS